MRKYTAPIVMLAIFETIAITLWITKHNIFYLFNFSYIGCSIALGIFLYIREYEYARRIVQLLVGMYMLIIICSQESLRQQRYITQWPKYSVLWSSAGAGAAMHAGQRWCWIFFPGKCRFSRAKSSDGSDISLLPFPLYL